MKKILTRILAIMMLIVCALPLVACVGQPNFDLSAAKDQLEIRGYMVVLKGEESEFNGLVVVQYLSATKDKNRLVVAEYESVEAAKLAYKYAKTKAENDIKEIRLMIKTLNYYVLNYSDELMDYEIDICREEIKEYKLKLKEERIYCGRSGKIVWEGTRQAIKDSKN